jgi:hypothetical protein
MPPAHGPRLYLVVVLEVAVSWVALCLRSIFTKFPRDAWIWIYRLQSANGECSRKILTRTASLFDVIMTDCVFFNSVSMRRALRATFALPCSRLADRVNADCSPEGVAPRSALGIILATAMRELSSMATWTSSQPSPSLRHLLLL